MRYDRLRENTTAAMTESLGPAGSPQTASLAIRKALLDALGVPMGTATVARRRTQEGDTLVVRLIVPDLLPAERRPDCYRGFPVAYEIVGPVKIGHY
jgi:hypothetical protein